MSLIIYSVLIAFFLSIIQGPLLIPMLHKLKFGQNIREEGPKSHLKKAGTPTMGGIIFMTSTIITMLIIVRHTSDESMIALYCFIAFGLIGLIDDVLKIKHKKNEGLSSKKKML
ncbi:MAG: phospho-N-acetylmuramoyl-pentapeptide-transferase, partial [Clostridium sp.]